jgi:hypothetical protein
MAATPPLGSDMEDRLALWRHFAATVVLVLAAAAAQAQMSTPNAPADHGAFSGASFSAAFRKYTPPASDFSPFYSWDAHMQLDVTVFRPGRGAINFLGLFQTIGTENLGPKVSVGGTGYLLGLGYTHAVSNHVRLSAGLKHLSTHLTRDLDKKDADVRNRGMPVPKVDDPSEYNVFFFELFRRFAGSPLKPELDVIVESPNFRFNGDWLGFVRPLYLDTRWMLWERQDKVVVLETQHEFGRKWFNSYSLAVELFRRHEDQGRFQIFIIASPGHDLHVSPNIGGLRDGIAIGLRIRFQT